ncbi:hypothetical protein [Rhodopirellula sp. MGV]|uniref:hypothetical protein n=1 Tax=Rhodopirellula sp. MGV TaxID=2023130 RepID=UPI000B96AAFA|nr:hypothetical protein [Rhodopirellula sp. MGV]OYP36080.1 hypothetical protein CGZ80_10060 [Rhodopirellula sp. MGV]PNY36563.1 hypothetical protein C2E31_11950 [Rhodopirellula baltica]
MELRDAMQQISEIRQQMAQTEVFRGYRSLTVASSGMLGLAAAAVHTTRLQPASFQSSSELLDHCLTLWLVVASINVGLVGLELLWRIKSSSDRLTGEKTRLAVEQFAPCLVIGGLLTICIQRGAPEASWMLPGLWSLVFGQGIFASRRMLPNAVIWSAMYYVICGCCWLRWGDHTQGFSALQMAISFGGGQFLSAAILYWNLERHDATKTEPF